MSTPIRSGRWCRGVLSLIGMKPTLLNVVKTRGRITAMLAWKRAENGSRPCNGVQVVGGPKFNGFATTERLPGSTDYNSVHVQNYIDALQGEEATARTLTNGRYPNILKALASGDPTAICTSIANSPWGTGLGALNTLPYVQSNRRAERLRLIG